MKQTLAIYAPMCRRVITLAGPIIAGQLGQVLLGFFDTLQIGGLGTAYIAASGFANTVYWLTNLLGVGLLFGVSPLVSEAFGEKNEWKAVGVYRSGMLVAAVASVVFMLLQWWVVNNLYLFRQTETVTTLSVSYLRIVNFSTLFVFLFTAGKQLLDGMGRTLVGMCITLLGLGLNVLLNWLLIYGHWGLPAMGIEGAAWATSISRVAMCLALLVFIWRDSKLRQLRARLAQQANAAKGYAGAILRIGVPSGFQFFMEVAAFSAGQIMSGWLGESYLASHQIAINLASITFMVLMGIASAGTIMTGFAYGARNRNEMRMAGNTVLGLTIFIELVFAGLFFALSGYLPGVYTNNSEVIGIASSLIILAAFFQISDGLQAAAAGLLRGMQDVRVPVVIAFVSYWLIMIPGSYLLAFTLGMGIKGLWVGFIIGLSVAATLLLWRFRVKVRNVVFTEL